MMHEPRLNHVQCLEAPRLRRMAYWEWGDPQNPRVLVCVHGLSRQGRDFDTLARAMQGEYRVVCPDIAGRGQSDWLKDPAGYNVFTYASDIVTLVARLHPASLDWVGTSMGGLIGMVYASLKGCPVRRMVLNDVGPHIEPASLVRIGEYLGEPKRWASVEEAAEALWQIAQSFGPHTPEQWLALTRPQVRPDGDGFTQHYDLNIAAPFRTAANDASGGNTATLWAIYEAIQAQVLLIRGAESDLLSRETAEQMTQRGPKAQFREFAGVGHAPTLIAPDQVAAVREFLLAP
jgi:pimeloyl-ACP methyl ester carboxylesterase